MKHLHCTTCKFTLPVGSPEEAATYEANMPMHCGQPMVTDGASASPAPTEAAPKEEKKGLFGGKSKKKKG